MKTLRIEVTFPVAVELPDNFQQRLIELVDEVCGAYESAHPGRVMWPAGVGSKITFMPLTREEEKERGVEFDDDTLSIEVAERERYHRWFIPKRAGIDYPCCRECGIIKNEGNEFGECRGKVKVELRSAPQEGDHE